MHDKKERILILQEMSSLESMSIKVPTLQRSSDLRPSSGDLIGYGVASHHVKAVESFQRNISCNMNKTSSCAEEKPSKHLALTEVMSKHSL